MARRNKPNVDDIGIPTTKTRPGVTIDMPVPQIRAEIRRNFALKCRLEYMSYNDVAAEVIKQFGVEALPAGYDWKAARSDIKTELNKVRDNTEELVEQVRTMELITLDQMEAALVETTTKGFDTKGKPRKVNTDAIRTRLQIMEHRAKLIPGLHQKDGLNKLLEEGGIMMYIPSNGRENLPPVDGSRYLPEPTRQIEDIYAIEGEYESVEAESDEDETDED